MTDQPKRRRETDIWLDENHNPLILEDCAHCYGSGKACEHTVRGGADVHTLMICPSCRGTGTTGKTVRYFQNESTQASAVSDEDGWVKCPGCGKRFTTRDRHRWSGLRHITCGQRIEIEMPNKPPEGTR